MFWIVVCKRFEIRLVYRLSSLICGGLAQINKDGWFSLITDYKYMLVWCFCMDFLFIRLKW